MHSLGDFVGLCEWSHTAHAEPGGFRNVEDFQCLVNLVVFFVALVADGASSGDGARNQTGLR
jgi:hypothetical protein